ncbi:hypothetical protein LOZ53_006195 [Ophidiomyces ophidiicola]|nr:hypothetical protein LOZ64_003077 [Ophidiomyces ophidiicola]KAI1980643.1 hypothetical protein LOZ55_001218 [Ophidiomyces ophidiicola]KAI1982711.1 hypothetical protein LOZ53_006195 [Ophidiomyces ophidiicola]KAI1992638.1 hypothetical protein LOZ54_001606 [Ophidiomyces ophidiicola]KAI1999370.1 hypothetical protein LOZ51_001857 [Ophidiomyces ophidiicola]
MNPTQDDQQLLLSEKLQIDNEADGRVWYFAYGSNMNSETFTAHRGIKPLATVPVRIPGWMLSFDIYGMPYQEPSFSSISQIPPRVEKFVQAAASASAEVAPPPVHGTAYLVSHEDYISIIGSEGGGIAYDEIEVLAQSVTQDGDNKMPIRSPFKVMTLVRAYGPTVPRHPSKRYLDLLIEGSHEAHLPSTYESFLYSIPSYQAPNSGWRKIGAALFLALWAPIMKVAEELTKATANSDGQGNCPAWVQGLVRLILVVMWFHHDFIHSKVWGRGDGLDQNGDAGDIAEKAGAIYLE